MNCDQVHELLLDLRRDRLSTSVRAETEAHLATCAACRADADADAELSRLLAERLPRPRAPASLRAALEARRPVRARPTKLFMRTLVGAVAFAAAIAIGVSMHTRSAVEPLVAEAVNDHLRVLYSEHPIEIESGGVHQVKPWFSGRVDFAPVIAFGGDADFPLQGGAVGYFVDRKAATFVFRRRLHAISLFVFRADGLPLPTTGTISIGRARATSLASRGFHVLLWRDGDLGYALVSDVDTAELITLATKLSGG